MLYQESEEQDGIMMNSTNDNANTTTTTRLNGALHTDDNINHDQSRSTTAGTGTTARAGICSSLFPCCSTSRSGKNHTTSNNSSSSNNSIFTCTALHLCCNTLFIIALSVLLVLMGMRLQTLQDQLVKDEERISSLQTQITNQSHNQQTLNQRVTAEHSLTLYQISGTFTLLTCLICTFHITQHLSNYHQPIIQRKIIAILWMSPIYSITSFLSLIFTSVDEYLAVIKDCYEAYTIYTFLSFLIAVLGRGDRDAAIQVLSCHADHLHSPTKCLSSFYYPSPETSPTAKASAVLTECQILALQFVLVRPISSILIFISDVLLHKNYSDSTVDDDPYSYFKSPNFYIAMITNVSVFFAFNGLIKFYHAVHVDLKWCQPFSKFLSIKSIVFLTFWQGLLISIIINVNDTTRANTSPITIPSTGTTPTPTPVLYPTPSIPAPTIYDPISVTPNPSATSNDAVVSSSNNNNNNVTRHNYNLLQRYLDDPHHTVDDEVSNDNSSTDKAGSEDMNDTSDKTGNNHSAESNDTTRNSSSSSSSKSNKERASKIQNFLICLEMLLFAIGHWCVFPVEEWKPDYCPPMNYAKPGFGIGDFAKDISDIVGTATRAHRRRRRQHHTNATYQKTNDTEETSSHTDRCTAMEDSSTIVNTSRNDNCPSDIMNDDYDNDDVSDTENDVNVTYYNERLEYDDVTVSVQFGDATIAAAAAYDDDDGNLSANHNLRTIT